MTSRRRVQQDPESAAHRRSLGFRAMPSLSALELFAVAAFALIVVPGPAVLYIVSQSVGHGRRGGLAAVFGVEIGAFVHVAGAALGVSAVIASSATAFSALKLAGGAYLVVLGIKRLRQRDAVATPDAIGGRAHTSIFRQGLIVSALNPKTALFFLAFLPQFVDPDRGAVALQVGILGLIFVSIALTSDAAYALLADLLAGRVRRGGSGARIRRLVSGGIFVALGISAAAARRA
jgi:threonine/homoserine/homoserine lactone efflux protein